MGTITRSRTKSQGASTPSISSGKNMGVFEALCAQYEVRVYGSGQPLYELLEAFGVVEPLNTLDTALQSFDEIRSGTKPGDAVFSFSEQYNRFSIALNLPEKGICFVGILHDQNGSPRVDEALTLCWVQAAKDFEYEGEVIVRKGQQFLKAMPGSYVSKMKKAA